MGSGHLGSEHLERALDALLERVARSLDSTGDAFPYFADPETGEWETTPAGNWCGGHWVGLLRLAAEHAERGTESERYRVAARSHTETLHEYMPHETMFCGMNFHYAGFAGFDATGDRSLFGIGLEGADAMTDLYHEGARQIPIGQLEIEGPEQFRGPDSDHGPSGDRIGAVDDIYTTLPILWRAYEETGDSRFRDVAVSHADRHLDWYLREDGSTWHHAVFDRETGELERQYNELARSDDTCWARGQGWNIAGLARAYRETDADRYLDALERAVEYHRRNSPDDGVPYWDYAASGDEPRDTSAAALIAYGLVRLSEEPSTAALRDYGRTVLDALLSSYLVTDPDAENRGAVLQGCFNRPGRYADDNELIWTDYYVARAVSESLDRA
ncbi:glycoside hydrolase family 88 protein [Halococcus agarilyticus]|uniref:glycoside hydrolase family 88 protein n=1 Tax=Halococcus agarilyticus TaxID=1232219 RepID=UPI0006782989|nr:glycoside hydrolase family 88 protein [Halococcus agarilyticus]